jgi:toxin ParE1/3/4
MAKVRYSKLASSDLYENSEFIARDKPEAAYRWVEKIEAACQTLAVNPEMGQRRISKNHGECRSFSCGSYVIEGWSMAPRLSASSEANAIWTTFRLRCPTEGFYDTDAAKAKVD